MTIESHINANRLYEVLKLTETPASTEDLCYHHYVRQRLLLEKPQIIEKLWLVPYSQASACDHLFDFWLSENLFSQNDFKARYFLALQADNIRLMKYLEDKITDKSLIKHAKQFFYSPDKLIHYSAINSLDHHLIMTVVEEAAKRKTAQDAETLMRHIEKKIVFSQKEKLHMASILSLYFAAEDDQKSEMWFESVPIKEHTLAALEWQTRYRLKHGQWTKAKKIILEMPKSEQDSPTWQYWLAQIEIRSGQSDLALKRLSSISNEREFYGMMAALETQQNLPFQNKALPITEDEKSSLAILLNPIKQNLEENNPQAAAEQWRLVKDLLPERERYIAARLALEWNAPDLAIKMSKTLEHQDDLSIRFPMHHRAAIQNCAHKYGFDPALIYAMIRQESAYQSQAASQDGAVGLMQILQSTARYVARKENLSYFGKQSLKKPEKNIALGCAYLSYLNQKLEGQLLPAIAAYNMGPKHLMNNLPSRHLPAILWVETLPREETREYLKNILTYTLIYQYLDNRKPSLNRLIRPVRNLSL